MEEIAAVPYRRDWPDSVQASRFPSPFLQHCDLTSGAGCVMPPKGPGHFYPFFTKARAGGRCVWEFGNMHNGRTFGGDAQYGTVRPGTLGAFVGPVLKNAGC
jgi:hypothetical protein